MCHDPGSAPPAPAGAGAAGGADGHLTSSDGARFMAYQARPARPTGAGAVILPDFRGLHGFYKQLALRLAGAGVAAVAIDYFGRQLPDGEREDPPEAMLPLVTALRPEQVAADARAATDRLRSGALGDVGSVFSFGFCFGGSQSWIQSAFDHSLAGCIGFYGRPGDCRPYLARMRPPLLMLVAGADAMTPVADFERFRSEVSAAGVEHDMVVYEGVPHSFFDGGRPAHAAVCADAWRRVLDFIARRSARR